MEHVEDYLRVMPEVIHPNEEQKRQFYKDFYRVSDDYVDRYGVSWNDEAYLAITTNSARYKVSDEGHWTDLVCFKGDPLEATKKLYDWLVKNNLIK